MSEAVKWLIASDIHGSAYYCELLLERLQKEGADSVLLLGDLLYHGPRNDLPRDYDPKRVIGMLNGISDQIFCVRGNCEAEVDQMVLDFPVMAEFCLLTLGKRRIFATHGHIYNNGALPKLRPGDVLLHGHTHVPALKELGSHIYINPGSVSIPKEESPHSYMTLEEGCFLWKELETGKEYMRLEV